MNASIYQRKFDPHFLLKREQALYNLAVTESRIDFGSFRRFMHPEMHWGWWTQIVADALQQFYEDMLAEKRPKLAIYAPPQHGKSMTAEDFIAWCSGRNPVWKTIYGSYSADLGMRANHNLQIMMRGERYRAVFPNFQIGGAHDLQYKANTELIQFIPPKDYIDPTNYGSFRNTTVNGPINGMGLHLGVIDDPIKNRAEASSQLIRDKTWHWLTDDFLSRFDKVNGFLVIMTRWHPDDPMGRASQKWGDEFKIISFPAIATHNERYRRKGEPLFPEHKPLDFLLERKAVYSRSSWESLYQQTPIIVGGGMFPIEKIKVIPIWDVSMIKRSIRYIDKAGTADGDGAQTAMVLMHHLKDGRFVIENIGYGRWGALDRERIMKEVCHADAKRLHGKPYEVHIEQEPGSGGKESVEASIRNLAGLRVFADRVTGDKVTRADPFSAQVQGGNVFVVAGSWINDYLEQLEAFPNGKLKDMVDASSGAFNKLTEGSGYDIAMTGWQ